MVVCEEQSPGPAEEKDPRKCVVVRNMRFNIIFSHLIVIDIDRILEEKADASCSAVVGCAGGGGGWCCYIQCNINTTTDNCGVSVHSELCVCEGKFVITEQVVSASLST